MFKEFKSQNTRVKKQKLPPQLLELHQLLEQQQELELLQKVKKFQFLKLMRNKKHFGKSVMITSHMNFIKMLILILQREQERQKLN